MSGKNYKRGANEGGDPVEKLIQSTVLEVLLMGEPFMSFLIVLITSWESPSTISLSYPYFLVVYSPISNVKSSITLLVELPMTHAIINRGLLFSSRNRRPKPSGTGFPFEASSKI